MRNASNARPSIAIALAKETSFESALLEAVQNFDPAPHIELLRLGMARADAPCQFTLILDRISHEVPFIRTYLKHAVVQGSTVINDPFMWTADDKFFGATLATRLGIAVPRTVVLPNQSTMRGAVAGQDITSLSTPVDWDTIIQYVGMPCVLKDTHGNAGKDVFICKSKEHLIRYYEYSGQRTMIVQEYIEFQHYLRCFCIGREHILPVRNDTTLSTYYDDNDFLDPKIRELVTSQSRTLMQALGYDLSTVEWAVRDEIPYAIDFMNPIPDLDATSLPPRIFQWIVDRSAAMLVDAALQPHPQQPMLDWAPHVRSSATTAHV